MAAVLKQGRGPAVAVPAACAGRACDGRASPACQQCAGCEWRALHVRTHKSAGTPHHPAPRPNFVAGTGLASAAHAARCSAGMCHAPQQSQQQEGRRSSTMPARDTHTRMIVAQGL
eukprot:218839-Chlamydomonas_euryale.AAC.6